MATPIESRTEVVESEESKERAKAEASIEDPKREKALGVLNGKGDDSDESRGT